MEESTKDNLDWIGVNDAVPQKQRSEEWLKWRKGKIGASEIGVLAGFEDFKTVQELFEEKTGRREPFTGNWATKRGTEAEPKIRELYEAKTFTSLSSPVMEYGRWPVLIASLDGLTSCGSKVVEFKYPSRAMHAVAQSALIPEKYYPQIQIQMLISGAICCDYVSYDGTDIVVVPGYYDEKYAMELVDRAMRFWDAVLKYQHGDELTWNLHRMNPPKHVSESYESVLSVVNEWAEKTFALKQLQAQVELLKSKIESHMEDKDSDNVGPFMMKWSYRKGNVDYSKIEVLKTIDLDSYRKEDIKMLQIKAMEVE